MFFFFVCLFFFCFFFSFDEVASLPLKVKVDLFILNYVISVDESSVFFFCFCFFFLLLRYRYILWELYVMIFLDAFCVIVPEE